MSILNVILALLGLSFLVFINELGHYLVGKWVGMRIEVFSIGFGKPLVSWKRGEVQWQIGILPFGGFVKFAGMDDAKVEGGFFSKTPWQRIKVAFANPL